MSRGISIPRGSLFAFGRRAAVRPKCGSWPSIRRPAAARWPSWTIPGSSPSGERNAASHSARLLRSIDQLLKLASWDITDIGGFAAPAGPGSFTGIRVGLSTIKALSFASGKPVAAVSSLAALAVKLRDTGGRLLCPLIDAKKSEVYAALYDSSGGKLEDVIPQGAYGPDALSRFSRRAAWSTSSGQARKRMETGSAPVSATGPGFRRGRFSSPARSASWAGKCWPGGGVRGRPSSPSTTENRRRRIKNSRRKACRQIFPPAADGGQGPPLRHGDRNGVVSQPLAREHLPG